MCDSGIVLWIAQGCARYTIRTSEAPLEYLEDVEVLGVHTTLTAVVPICINAKILFHGSRTDIACKKLFHVKKLSSGKDLLTFQSGLNCNIVI